MISWKTAVIHIALVLIGTEVNAQQLILVHVVMNQ